MDIGVPGKKPDSGEPEDAVSAADGAASASAFGAGVAFGFLPNKITANNKDDWSGWLVRGR